MTSAGWWKIKERFFCRNVVRFGNAISPVWWVFLLSGWIVSGKLYGHLLLLSSNLSFATIVRKGLVLSHDFKISASHTNENS